VARPIIRIAAWKVRCAQDLIDGGEVSMRRIAAELGIARGTLERLRTTPPPSNPFDEEDEDAEELQEFLSTLPYKCGECGAWVTFRPCVACAARSGPTTTREPELVC
jgi:hypothetical protein